MRPLKVLSLAFLSLVGGGVGALHAQNLNQWDIYLSVVDKEALLPAHEQRTIAVTIGNGFTSKPTETNATLRVMMDKALADSIVANGQQANWASTNYPGVICEPLNAADPLGTGSVEGICHIPPLPTGAKFDLGVALYGQAPWTSNYMSFAIDPLKSADGSETETFIKNQSEDLVVTSVSIADLSIETTVSLDGTVVATVSPSAPQTIPAVGGQTYDFGAKVTNHGSSDVDSFYVTVPKLAGFTEYVLPAGCEVTVVDGTDAYSCLINQPLKVGQSYTLPYKSTVMSPQSGGGNSSVPMNNITSTADGNRLPRDLKNENNSVEMIFDVAPGGDVSIDKRLTSTANAVQGDIISYEITPNYLGLSPGMVEVRDVIPANFDIESLTPVEMCSFDAATREVLCLIPAPAANAASRTALPAIGLQLKSLPNAPTAFVNEARVSAPNNPTIHDTNGSNNVAKAPIVSIALPKYDVEATKVRIVDSNGGNDGYAVVGQTIDYQLNAKNIGNVALTDRIVIIDKLPEGLAYTGYNGNGADWSCLPAASAAAPLAGPVDITCTYVFPTGALGVQETLDKPITLHTTVVGLDDPAYAGSSYRLANSAVAEWEGPGIGKITDIADHEMIVDKVDRIADISIDKARDQATVEVGDYQTYSLTVKNAGYLDPVSNDNSRFTAEDVTVTDVLSNLYSPYSVTDPSASVILEQGAASTYCKVTANPQGNPQDAPSATLLCTIPRLDYCEVGATAPTKECEVITFRVRQGGISSMSGSKLQQANSASILSVTTPDPDYTNNSSTVSHEVTKKFALKLAKVSSQDGNSSGYGVGQAFRYTITVENAAPAAGNYNFTYAPAFKVVDTLPAGIRVLSIQAAGSGLSCPNEAAVAALPNPTIAGTAFTCDVAEGLAVGDVRTITVVAEGSMDLIDDMTGNPPSVEIDNVAAIELAAADAALEVPTPGGLPGAADDNIDNAKVKMTQGAYDLDIKKTVESAYLRSGDMATFNLRVVNVGLARAEDVKVVDGLPPASLFQFERAYVKGRESEALCSTSTFAGHATKYLDASGSSTVPMGYGDAIECAVGDLLPEQSVEIKVIGRMLTAGNEENYSSVSAKVYNGGVQDDYNYRNNFSYTHITAQEMVDLKMEKQVLPSSKTDSPRFKYDEVITFLLKVTNTARIVLPPGDQGTEGDYRPYYTDASKVVLTDNLPLGLAYEGTIVAKLNGVVTPGLCAAPAAGSRAFSCTVATVANGATVEVELPSYVTTNCGGAGAPSCQTDPATKEQYFELENKAVVTSSAAQPVPDTEPDEAKVPVQILLSSISGHYWWDMQDNLLSGSSDRWAYNPGQEDELIKDMTLTLQVKDAMGNWVDRATTKTDANGYYHFDYLVPGEYRIVDKTVFTNNVTQVGDRLGVIGAVTEGTIPSQSSGFGSASNLNSGSSRDISSIMLEADRHGVNYDLRIVPVPEIGVQKDVVMNQLPNALLELTYTIKVSNLSAEPLNTVKLDDPLIPLFTAYDATLKTISEDPIEAAKVRDLGPGMRYAVRSTTIATDGGSNITLNAAYTGEASGNKPTVFENATLAVGETATVTMRVIVTLGQPMSSTAPASYNNIAYTQGVGTWTGFTSENAGNTPEQSGDDRTTPTLKTNDDAIVTPSLQSSIDLIKSVVARSELGPEYDGKLVYKFVIHNDGTVPLSNIVLTDAMLGISQATMGSLFTDLANQSGSGITGPLRPAGLDLLLEDERIELYAVYTLTAADVATLGNGNLSKTNTATVEGKGHTDVTDSSSVTTTSGLAIVKTPVLPHTAALKAGDVIQYRITVTNTGNLPLRDAYVTDDVLIASGGTSSGSNKISIGPFDLDADEVKIIENAFSYTVLQSDIDALSADAAHPLLQVVSGKDNVLHNIAKVSGEYVPGQPTDRKDDADVPLVREPAMTVEKTAQTIYLDPASPKEGERIVYAVVIKNTGNTVLTNLTLTDTPLGLTGLVLAAPNDSLAAGESLVLYGPDYDLSALAATTKRLQLAGLSQSLTWEMIAAKSFTNTASVDATPPGKSPITEDDDVTVNFPGDPQIELEKTVTPTSGLTFDAQGFATPKVTYAFTVTNTGNVPLDQVVITDPLLRRTIDVSAVIGGDGKLWPGESQLVELRDYQFVLDPTGNLRDPQGELYADYALLLAGLNAGDVLNTATVTSDYEGQTPSDDDDASIVVDPQPAFTVVKTGAASVDGRSVDWRITVKNTGNVTLAPLSVTDSRLAGRSDAGFDAAGVYTITSLEPQREHVIIITADATSLAERDAGKALNEVSVTYTPPSGPPVTEDASSEPPLPAEAGVQIIKDDDPTFTIDNGSLRADIDTLSYDFWIKNTGSVGLSGITFRDDELGLTIDDKGVMTIKPEFAGKLTVDLNMAMLSYLPPSGDYAAYVAANNLNWPALEKDGSVLLGSVTVKIPQGWIDAGSINNVAIVAGTPPGNLVDKDNKPLTPVTDDDDVTTPFTPEPDLVATKEGALVTDTNTPVAADVPTKVGDWILWTFTVENTGNVTLGRTENGTTDPFTLTEGVTLDSFEWLTPAGTIGSGAGNVWTFNALEPGAKVTLQARSKATLADIQAGKRTNDATVYARHKSGKDVTKSPTTEVPFTLKPALSIEKTLCTGTNCTAPTGKMRFEIKVTNIGNMVLNTVTVTEVSPRMVFARAGDFNASTDSLSNGDRVFTRNGAVAIDEVLVLYADYTIPDPLVFTTPGYDLDDLAYYNAGKVTNIATAEGEARDPVSGTTTPTEKVTDDAEGPLDQKPSVTIEKSVISPPLDSNGNSRVDPATLQSQVGYSLIVTNTGNVTLTELLVEDPRLNISVKIGPLAPAESLDLASLQPPLVLTTTPTQAELDKGHLLNTATVKTTHNGTEYSDDDNTDTVLVPVSALSLVKEATRLAAPNPAKIGETVRYRFTVTNDGDITLDPVVLTDDLFAQGWSHTFAQPLAPKASVSLEVDYLLTAADVERGWVYNTAQVKGDYLDENGNPQSVDDTDEVLISYDAEPSLRLVKVADATALSTPPDVGQLITYTFTLENTSEVVAKEIELRDAMQGVTFNGSTKLAALNPGETHVFTATYALRQEDLDRGHVENTATADFSFVPDPNLPPGFVPPAGFVPPGPKPMPEVPSRPDPSKDPAPTVTPLVMKGEFTARKSADMETVVLGDSVTYTLSFESQSSGVVKGAHAVDRLPAGLIYTPDSAKVAVTAEGGSDIFKPMEPQVAGRRLDWGPLDVPRKGRVTVTFEARVSQIAPFGKLTNDTWIEGRDGDKLSNTASATVVRLPEHVFECSDVTGKVFEDFNHNGRQDPRDTSALTNDDVYGGKWGKYETLPKEPRGERGLAHVRLVTPTGTIITTDEHGRYSVPCAELPRDLGSNFTLKLDTRSLPTGYRVTTENPRTLRLTAGKAAEMNFGVAMSKLVRLDLGGQAFVAGKAEPSQALSSALRDYAARAADEPVVIHLGYRLSAKEDRGLAKKRLDMVEDLLRREWKGRHANLMIERSLEKASN